MCSAAGAFRQGGYPAAAVTDSGGKFSLKTYWNPSGKELEGASPGSYVVTVTKVEVPTQDELDRAIADCRAPKRKHLVPEKYSKAKTSGLNYEVKKGSHHFDIVLED